MLREVLRDKKTALAGMSGTGKSSLISAVQPGLSLRISHVSKSGEGRHTTTQATMLGLDIGGFAVDTPGIRAFGLSGLRRHELAAFYPEIASLALKCRFNNCSHVEEPGCARDGGPGEWRSAFEPLPLFSSNPRNAVESREILDDSSS